MSKALFVSEILKGITQGFAAGSQIKQKREDAETLAAQRQDQLGLQERRVEAEESRLTLAEETAAAKPVELTFEQFQALTPEKQEQFTKFQSAKKGIDFFKEKRKEEIRTKKEGVKEVRQTKKDLQAIFKDFQIEARPIFKAQASSKRLRSLLKSVKGDNELAWSSMKAQIAQIWENGRLTDEDVERYSRAQGISRRSSDKLKLLTFGGPTTATINEMNDIINIIDEASSRRIVRIARRQSRGGAERFGLERGQVLKGFGLSKSVRSLAEKDELEGPPQPTQTPTPTPQPAANAIQAEIQRRREAGTL